MLLCSYVMQSDSKIASFSVISQLKKDSKIFALLFALLVIYYAATIGTTSDKGDFLLIDISYFAIPLAVALGCFAIARKNIVSKSAKIQTEHSRTFGRSHISLGIAFLMMAAAEFTYIVVYQVILGADPYSSIADVFYLLFYPLALFYLIKNIRYFLILKK